MTYILHDYDKALSQIMDNGWDQQERTGNNCRTFFGIMTRFDISSRAPVLTYRKINWKSYVKEALWYISGSDKISDLQAAKCNVWTPWINDEFTQQNGFEDTSIGYGYGPNLIHYGAEISKLHPVKNGFNQLDYVINTLRTNPCSRQAMFVLWRPDKIKQVLLPACHFAYHFLVSPNENGEMKKLSCQLFQRSADYPIGVGAGNLFIATLFTHMIAQQVDMQPHMLIHSTSHSHIYHNSFDATNEYIQRTKTLPTLPSPRLLINKRSSIYDYTIDDFDLVDYKAYDKIVFPIAV